jgi:hypothetical protein
MDLQSILIGGIVGLVSGLITAYAAMRFRLREERDKWNKDLALKYAATHAESPTTASNLAEHFGVGVLIVHEPQQDRRKHFILPGTRLIVGRRNSAHIAIAEPMASLEHMAFEARESGVFAVDFSTNGIFVCGEHLRRDAKRLESGDVVMIGNTQITFVAL